MTVRSDHGATSSLAIKMNRATPQTTALVVEDEILLSMEVCDLLGEDGYATIGVTTAAEALRRLDDAVSLVVTDIHMPGAMNGLGLAREIARLRPDVAVVVVSARTIPTPSELPEGVAFVGRPFLESRVRAAVRVAVANKSRSGDD